MDLNIPAKCCRLLVAGALPRSQCGAGFLRRLKPLFDAGVVRWEKSAAGQRLSVLNLAAYGRWFSLHFPGTKVSDSLRLSPVEGVARFRDSKALRGNLPAIVCIRSTKDGVLVKNGVPVETTKATVEHGVFAFKLDDPTAYALNGNCVLIENLAVFQLFEHLNLDVNLAIWTGGISSNRLLNWLATNINNGLRILHLPDYDPVGMTEFLRYHRRLGDAVSLHSPDNLRSLFHSYSKAGLLLSPKNQRMLLRLRKAQHPAVERVLRLMHEFNGGLEHEAILIPVHEPRQKESVPNPV